MKRQDKERWTILLKIYLLCYIAMVFSGNGYSLLGTTNNTIFFIALSVVTFSLFALIFEQFLSFKKFKIFNRTVIILVVLFFVVNAVWLEGPSIFNSYSSGIASFILLAYCIYYYKLQLDKPQIIFVEKLPSFWIVSGIFIYSAGTFFLWSMYNSLTRNYPTFAFYSWYINDFLLFIMNIFFAKGIQCNSHK